MHLKQKETLFCIVPIARVLMSLSEHWEAVSNNCLGNKLSGSRPKYPVKNEFGVSMKILKAPRSYRTQVHT